jgi:ubiquinone/menaquinone biosynthesis C-methylase UbiE
LVAPGPFGLGACEPNFITVETRSLLARRERATREGHGDGLSNSPRLIIEQQGNGRRSISVGMNSDEKWSRRRAVEVHDETADGFFAEYRGDNIFDSPFRYGRHLINRAWTRCVSQLPPGATCLDIGCGVGAHMVRLLDHGFKVTGIEPSAEMRRLAAKNIPADLVSDGSVLQLPVSDSSIDFVYAIEVFRYLDARDNAQGHREIVRVLKPGGIYFGTYVNKWALDGFRQLSQFRKLTERMVGTPRRYHVEFETPSSLCDKLRAAGFSQVKAHGAMFAPLRVLHKASPRLGTAVSRLTMPHETWLSDYGPLRWFAGHLIIIARR